MYFWRAEKCTFSGLIVVLFVFFCKSCRQLGPCKVVVLVVGSKFVLLVFFLWYFSGVFSTFGTYSSCSGLICGTSRRFLRYFWWKSPTRCIWCIFRGFRVPCLSNDVLPVAKTAIRDHFSIVIHPILIHKTALRIVIWLSWRLEPSKPSTSRNHPGFCQPHQEIKCLC